MAEDNSLQEVEHAGRVRARAPRTEPRAEWRKEERDGEKAPAVSGGLLGDLRLTGRANTPIRAALMLRAQQAQGNRAVQRAMNKPVQRQEAAVEEEARPKKPEEEEAPPVQRQEAGRTEAPPPAVASAAWSMPFNYGKADNFAVARLGLYEMITELEHLQPALDNEETKQLKGHVAYLRLFAREFTGEGPLGQKDVDRLERNTILAITWHDQVMGDVKARMAVQLETFELQDTSDVANELAEKLHLAFISGASASQLSKLKEAVGKLKDYNESAGKVVGWAKQAASAVKAAKTVAALEKAAGASESLGGVLGKVDGYLESAKSFAIFSGLINEQSSEIYAEIARFRAGLDLIDKGMGFAKAVPLLGTLWSKYYKPLTETCLKTIQKIAGLADVQGREYALVDWMEDARDRDPRETPRIPKGLERYFPGGQPVLDYMYPLFNGGEPVMTRDVERFLLKHKEQFEAGMGKDRIETESHWHWYNPFSWGAPDTARDLDDWIERNKEIVWMQLYGALPHDLR